LQNSFAKTLIFAHRGANREAAENTRSAFNRALNYPIDGIETDIQLSKDEVPVLWHDRFLNKLAGYETQHIDDFNLDELAELNFAAHFSPEHAAEGIMPLHDFLQSYRSRCHLLLEIKNRDWENPERHRLKVQKTLDQVGTEPSVGIMVSSFNLNSLIEAAEYRPNFPLIYNLEPEHTLAEAEKVLAEHAFLHGLCLPICSLNQAVVDSLRQQHKLIAVYTCNHDDEIQHALTLGVDILISDLPEKALQMRAAQVQHSTTSSASR
jgi:glycerophosphoryl diester phosphodiesterase